MVETGVAGSGHASNQLLTHATQPSMIYVYSAKGQSSSSLSYPELAFA